eukprot:TRINITY_DN2415_c0_g6_i1.p2 TRINITY_DN2415_c0_g6~~TRINITY_DN2415_c0_g6_i1.p2  ORF type:complete len:112 (+),score=36.64 TRINITY_DN2415_c0_g6_i1:125-460(+)
MKNGRQNYRKTLTADKLKSMSSIAKPARTKESLRLARARQELENELKKEREEMRKVANSGTYLTERMKSIFALPHERASTEGQKSVRVRQTSFTSKGLNKIGVSLFRAIGG